MSWQQIAAAAVITLLLAVGWWWESRQDAKARGDGWLVAIVTCLLLLATIFTLFVLGKANARDLDGRYAQSPNHAWFESQHNSNGQWCCNEADGHLYYGDYKLNDDGSVEAEGQRIESYKVLKGPNPTGAAVWWYVDGVYGRTTYCFAVGPGA